jgi:hypothetical protein
MKLYNLRRYKWDSEKKTTRHVATLLWNSPYALCKFKKRILEGDSRVDMLNGTAGPDGGFYYKIVQS